MNIAARYVGVQVFNSILVVLVILLSVDVVAELIDQMGRLRHQYGVPQVIEYILWTIPSRTVENLPLASLIGVLVGLGGLANTSELTVFRATGHSITRLASYALIPAIVIILVGMQIGEHLSPWMDQRAEAKRHMQRSAVGKNNVNTGAWLKLQGEFVHVDAVVSVTELAGVTRFIFDDNYRLVETQFAESAIFENDSWKLIDMHGSQLTEERAIRTNEPFYSWPADVSARLMRLSSVSSGELSVSELYDYAHFLDEQGQESGRHWLAFWRKLLQPLTTIGLVIVAISFVFGSLRQVSMGYRVFVGVIVGIVVQTLQNLLAPASLVYGFSPLIAVLSPTILCLLFGYMLIRRAG